MLDIKKIRENPAALRECIAKKQVNADIEAILVLDEERRNLSKTTDDMKHRRNTVSKAISGKKRNKENADAELRDMKELSAAIKENDARLADIQEDLHTRLLAVPNCPAPAAPVGKCEADNVEVASWGDIRELPFTAKDHLDIAEPLGILDMKRGAKIAGSGFPLYTGQGARLERALLNFMLDTHIDEHGYTEVFPPFLVHSDSATGTGQLPKMGEDMYYLKEDDLWLIPTAEVPVTNIFRDEVLSAEELPLRYAAFSACFRREAGSYGKDTRGLQRLHQFNKVEMVQFTHPEDSYRRWEELIGHAETILRRLKLPYRVMELCTADLSFAAARCRDIELWAPGSGKWLEVSSCSNFEDFQARRANIRFKDDGGVHYVHTINGSGVATPRLMIAVIENYQREDGSIEVPEVLRPYLGSDMIGR